MNRPRQDLQNDPLLTLRTKRVPLRPEVPAIATLGIMAFLVSWNQFLWPLVVLSSQERFTLPLGLSLLGLGSTFLVDDQLWMVAATLAVIPPLAFFLILQRPYLRGLETLSGLKEWHAPPRGLATCAQMGQDGADVASYGSPGADRVHRRRLVGDVCPPALAYHLPAGRRGGRR